MDDRRTGGRPRARSEAIRPGRTSRLLSPGAAESPQSAQRPAEAVEGDDDLTRSPPFVRRAATTLRPQNSVIGSGLSTSRSPAARPSEDASGSRLRRRETALSRTTNAGPRASSQFTRSRLRGAMGTAGPDDSPQLRAAHDTYVHPGYATINPAYEQLASSRPVWSLAKPLPRVVRPGMVPTRAEMEQVLTEPEPPILSQQHGLDLDPADLEAGRIQPTLDPTKLGAQLKDSRAQREKAYVESVARRATITRSDAPSRLGRVSSVTSRPGRRATMVSEAPRMTPTREAEEPFEESAAAAHDALEAATIDHRFAGRSSMDRMHSRGQDGHALEPVPEYHERASQDSNSPSQATLHVDDQPDLFAEMEEVQKMVENPPLYEEIHNNHTVWSVFRTHNREFLAELLGVFVQQAIGFSSDMSDTLNGSAANVNTTAFAWGFATMTGIYVSGGISGAHLNPIITLVLWFFRGFPARKMPAYFAAQFLGSFLAAAAAYALYLGPIRSYEASNPAINIVNGFVTSRRFSSVSPGSAVGNELLATALLAAAVLALGDDQNAPPGAGMNALVVGLLVTLLNFAFSYQSGAALNPARDFGPRLLLLACGYNAHPLFIDPYWFYAPWCATVAGGFAGASLYDLAVFEGGESPVNYPWERTVRGWKKWSERCAASFPTSLLPHRKELAAQKQDEKRSAALQRQRDLETA